MSVLLEEPGSSPLVIRELRPGDEDTLHRVFQGMTEEQRAFRYGSGMPRLGGAYVEALTATDRDRHVALVAEIKRQPVGIARYVVVGPGTADVAVEVVHAFTRRGIARRLLEELRRTALERGICRFTMEIMGVNARALGLARAAGARLSRESSSFQGVLCLDGSSGRRNVNRTGPLQPLAIHEAAEECCAA